MTIILPPADAPFRSKCKPTRSIILDRLSERISNSMFAPNRQRSDSSDLSAISPFGTAETHFATGYPAKTPPSPKNSTTYDSIFWVNVAFCRISSHRTGLQGPNFAKFTATRVPDAVFKHPCRICQGALELRPRTSGRVCNGGTPFLQAKPHTYSNLRIPFFGKPCISLHGSAAQPAFFRRKRGSAGEIRPPVRHVPRKSAQTTRLHGKSEQKEEDVRPSKPGRNIVRSSAFRRSRSAGCNSRHVCQVKFSWRERPDRSYPALPAC
jgi:hypothetical protein